MNELFAIDAKARQEGLTTLTQWQRRISAVVNP
jgi:hypothetical protein